MEDDDSSVDSTSAVAESTEKPRVDRETTVAYPSLRRPTRKDVVLTLHNPDYRQTMYNEFRELEVNREKVADAGRRVLSRFKAQLNDSGGFFFKKIGTDQYIKADEEYALKKIKQDLSDRTKTDCWRVVNTSNGKHTEGSGGVVPSQLDSNEKEISEGLVGQTLSDMNAAAYDQVINRYAKELNGNLSRNGLNGGDLIHEYASKARDELNHREVMIPKAGRDDTLKSKFCSLCQLDVMYLYL